MFDGVARRNDLTNTVLSMGQDRYWRKATRSALSIGPGQKVLDLAKLLTDYCGRLTVEIVPFTHIQEEIRAKCPEEYFTLIMRRFMMRIAEAIAEQNGCAALVTGEDLGQVASQTMEALRVTEAAARAFLAGPGPALQERLRPLLRAASLP